MTFGAVGAGATVTHYCVALSCNRLLGFHPLLANVAGYSAAVIVSYLGHSLLTFRRRVMVPVQFLRFLAISATGLAIGQVITYATTVLLRLPFSIALIPVVTLVPAFTFVASSLWAFAERPHALDTVAASPAASSDLQEKL